MSNTSKKNPFEEHLNSLDWEKEIPIVNLGDTQEFLAIPEVGGEVSCESVHPVLDEAFEIMKNMLADKPEGSRGWNMVLTDLQLQAMYCLTESIESRFLEKKKLGSEYVFTESDMISTIRTAIGISLFAYTHLLARWYADDEE